tara:strand:- start:23 stop:418 length:396 start_codon:yes stop_codon:yes gene_type:complete
MTVRRRLQHGAIGVALGLAALALLLDVAPVARSSPDGSERLGVTSSEGNQGARFACEQASAFLHAEAELLAVAGDGSSAECSWRLPTDGVEGTDCLDGRPPSAVSEVVTAKVGDGVVSELSRSDAVVQECA